MSSTTTATGHQFPVEVVADVQADGRVVIPAGARGSGTVIFARKTGKAGAPSAFEFRIDSVDTSDGVLKLKAEGVLRGEDNRSAGPAVPMVSNVVGAVPGRKGEIDLPVGSQLHAVVASGHAEVPPGVADVLDALDWMPKPNPRYGLVILYRESRFLGAAVKWQYYYDDQMFPKLRNGSFVYAYLPPGEYPVYLDKRERRDARLLTVEAGGVYILHARILVGAWENGGAESLPVDAQVALPILAKLKHPVLSAGK